MLPAITGHCSNRARESAGRVGRDVADDLAAETFLIAFRKRERVDPALGRVRAWLLCPGRSRRALQLQ
jgi:DNA-directed RNA polymerase specialized sigma24 family protein